MNLATLEAHANPAKAAEMAAYHKVARRYLGVANPVIHAEARTARKGVPPAQLAAKADALWQSNVHEARVAAASLLTLKTYRPSDEHVWQVLQGWVPDFDAWAVADHACGAIALRLVAEPSRLDQVETWIKKPNLWVRRAAMVSTLPWARTKSPDSVQIETRERILGWAEQILSDQDWFAQKCVAWWLRELSRNDPDRTRAFLEKHGAQMKAFARREAAKHLGS